MSVNHSEIPQSAIGFWREAYLQARAHSARHMDDGAEEAFWQSFAPGYDERSPLAECAGDLVSDLRGLIGSGWHLLEIGAGTGAFARRLAHVVDRITVVEPSASMRAEFERAWDRPVPIQMITSKWEDTPPTKADMVFGANAFYRIDDMAAALLKMNACARHEVALVQSVGRPHANPLAVTRDGVTEERERADVLCEILRELGISHRRRDYTVMRPDGPSRVALMDWIPKG